MGNRALYELFAESLEYPTTGLPDRTREYRNLLAGESGTSPATQDARGEAVQLLAEFASSAIETPLGQMEELYTSTFDLNPVCCPYVGYHLLGEDSKRAALMVKLQEAYRGAGYSSGAELPDHLAVLLRFLAVQDDNDLEHDLVDELLVPTFRKMADSIDAGTNPYGKLVRAALLTFS